MWRSSSALRNGPYTRLSGQRSSSANVLNEIPNRHPAMCRRVESLAAPRVQRRGKLVRRFIFGRGIADQRFEIGDRSNALLRSQLFERRCMAKREFRIVLGAPFHSSTIARLHMAVKSPASTRPAIVMSDGALFFGYRLCSSNRSTSSSLRSFCVCFQFTPVA